MSKLRAHLNLLANSLIGILKKWHYGIKPIKPLSNGIIDDSETKVIVSLTSFGRRVKDTVYYTILSIFNQTHRPDKIILWLDWDNWNEDNLPEKLKKLRDKGLEVRFCEDIRSYKKLIPALKLFPDDIIITVDDDVIYSPKLIESLYQSYKKYPKSVHCTRATRVTFKDKIPAPYKQWKKAISSDVVDNEYLFPVGIGGVLYPPHSLYPDVIGEDKFMRLAPGADDMWFWYMARLNGTNHRYVSLNPSVYSFDAIYQALHRGSALTHSNVGANKNDLQLAAILKEYDNKGV